MNNNRFALLGENDSDEDINTNASEWEDAWDEDDSTDMGEWEYTQTFSYGLPIYETLSLLNRLGINY